MGSIMKKPEIPGIRERTNPSGKKVYQLDYYDIREEKRVRSVVGFRKKVAQLKANQIYNEMMECYVGLPDKSKEDILT